MVPRIPRIQQILRGIIAQARRFLASRRTLPEDLDFFFLYINPLYDALEHMHDEMEAGDWENQDYVRLVKTYAVVRYNIQKLGSFGEQCEEERGYRKEWWEGRVMDVMELLDQVGVDLAELLDFQTESGAMTLSEAWSYLPR
ncbi:hypothetical protein W97_04759 [Coniosporium apollinis CBS 100218]|uniref:Uncharacterized protein n=1 Tax=Coniosporium apollinis (strain CBS 100218) TaxID=1168221 RepID=R7YV24_CONA1|nr:uncharacterized protein W97_04759 [Coniosporium apollinis CBS 100218]EON65521.1 hypothetical protein W97_04759 [Coniosporium apollinis CBS 100218]